MLFVLFFVVVGGGGGGGGVFLLLLLMAVVAFSFLLLLLLLLFGVESSKPIIFEHSVTVMCHNYVFSHGAAVTSSLIERWTWDLYDGDYDADDNKSALCHRS